MRNYQLRKIGLITNYIFKAVCSRVEHPIIKLRHILKYFREPKLNVVPHLCMYMPVMLHFYFLDTRRSVIAMPSTDGGWFVNYVFVSLNSIKFSYIVLLLSQNEQQPK